MFTYVFLNCRVVRTYDLIIFKFNETLCPIIWSILKNVSDVFTNNVYSAVVFCSIIYIYTYMLSLFCF